jgi:hypothetical protein
MRRHLDGQENAPHVDVQHGVDFLQADGLKIAHSQDTRVDDNDVETTKLGYRLGDGVADRRWVCAVCLDREAAKNDDALSKLRRRRKKHTASRDKARKVQ